MVDVEIPVMYRLPQVAPGERKDDVRVALRDTIEPGPKPVSALATSAATLAIPPAAGGLTPQLLLAVQRGHNLAQRGAFFAARTEFIQVLRRVAQAKDATAGNEEHSRQLANGLRALDEADDFVPRGTQLEGDMDVRRLASSHRTPVLHQGSDVVTPQTAIALYHSYAQQQLAQATLDEQAGSMALYGLGKVYSHQAERSDDNVQLVRAAMTAYAAALDACPTNHLAANELGVLLCRLGHPAEAVNHFLRAIDVAPNATSYHNLAVAQQKLGRVAQSQANERESQRLAAADRVAGAMSRHAGIQWVSPAELAQFSQPAPLPPRTGPTVAARPTTTLPPRQ